MSRLREASPYLILIGSCLFIRLPYLFVAEINWDASSYLTVGREVLDGHLPYTTLWSNKPPLLFLFYALMLVPDRASVIGVRVGGIILISLSSILIFQTLKRFAGTNVALISALILVLFASVKPGSQETMSEHVALIFQCGALWALLRTDLTPRWVFLVGLLVGLSVLLRSNLAYMAVAGVGAILILTRDVRSLMTYGLGVMLPIIAMIAIYGVAGQLDVLHKTLVVAPVAFVGSQWIFSADNLGVLTRLSKNAFSFQHYLLWTGFLVGTLWLWRRDRQLFPVVLIVLFLGVLYSIIKTGRLHDHYQIQLLPFMCFFVGWFIVQLIQKRIVLTIVVATGLVVPLVPVFKQYAAVAQAMEQWGTPFSDVDYRLAHYLNTQQRRGHYLYFCSHHIGYILARGKVPSWFVHPSELTKVALLKVMRGPEHTPSKELEEIFAKQPVYVVCSQNEWYLNDDQEVKALLAKVLATRYEKVEGFGELDVYRLQEGHRPPKHGQSGYRGVDEPRGCRSAEAYLSTADTRLFGPATGSALSLLCPNRVTSSVGTSCRRGEEWS